ncbi:hypothetical protein GIB67_040771 [Kingdonia uniflora]|uniref:NPH3 domain-containing protein n=1 Tax=Kingdonia uniflora TaxID=39325 RepID=A0A7J7LUJ7_9MAGN|nr:hypothetical protein GIB67_040771 [Kingdonia uniflora]
MLEENQNEEQLPYSLPHIPGDAKTFEHAMMFFHGHDLNLSAENVIPLICLACYLEMTEEHSPNNLLDTTLNFLQFKVLSSWDETIKALQTTDQISQPIASSRLHEACLDSLVQKANLQPRLLGDPIGIDDSSNNKYMPNARRRLFVHDRQHSGDVTTLTLPLYELVITNMIEAGLPNGYIAGSLLRYTRRTWIGVGGDGHALVSKKSYQRDVIETVEKLLPNEIGLLPCKLLFEMLQSAMALQAAPDCRHGLEIRIGKQLNEASIDDLLIPSQGYARELQYDIECVERILRTYITNYTSGDDSGLVRVAKLIEEFLAKVATENDLKKDRFIKLGNLSVSTSYGTNRSLDGIYHAIDIYLDKHGYLTESEKEEVCQILDFQNMSPEACTHAAQNNRLPLRVTVQALFIGQLHLREAIVSRVEDSESGSRKEDTVVTSGEEVKVEMEKMDSRVMLLEKECSKMRRQIGKDNGKSSVWKQLKRKFGCISSINEYNCNVRRKVHPRITH